MIYIAISIIAMLAIPAAILYFSLKDYEANKDKFKGVDYVEGQ